LKVVSTLLNQVFGRKKSGISLKKTTQKKKLSEDIFSSINHTDDRIGHCLQLAEDTLSKEKTYDHGYA